MNLHLERLRQSGRQQKTILYLLLVLQFISLGSKHEHSGVLLDIRLEEVDDFSRILHFDFSLEWRERIVFVFL